MSGHGLGHAARATQLMHTIPTAAARIIVFSVADRRFIEREAGRPVTVIARAWDHGPVQASDFAIDWQATFAQCIAKQKAIAVEGNELQDILRREQVSLVVSDIAPYPLAVAARMGIPGVCVANFTWCDVLSPRTDGCAEREDLIEAYRADYLHATRTLRTPLSFDMGYMPIINDIALIADRTTARRRDELRQTVGAADTDRLVALYLGLWGTGEMDIDRVAHIRGVRFVSYRPVGHCAAVVDPEAWPFDELITACDALVCKPGYGAFSSCMANGVPCVTYPREEFLEYFRLREGVDRWGGAVHMTNDDLMRGNWQAALKQAYTLHPKQEPATGATDAAKHILELLQT